MSQAPRGWQEPDGAGVLARSTPARRQVTLAVALIGCAICALAGGPVLVISVVAAAGILSGRRLGRNTPRAAARWRVLNTSALIVCVLAGFAKVPLLVVGTGLVGWLQIHRAWTGDSARDDRVALLLALLQSLLGCIVTVSLALAPLFVALTMLAPVGLALCHLGIEADVARAARVRPGGSVRSPTRLLWGVGPASLVLTALFFVALPRLEASGLLVGEEPDRITGFGDDVDIGDLGELLDNATPVMRVRVFDGEGGAWTGPLYLRGSALDHFDGKRWTATVGRGGRWRPPRDEAGLVRQEILLEPLDQNVLFGLQEITGVRGTGRRLTRDANGTLRFLGEPGRLEYTVRSRLPVTDPGRLAASRPDPRATARSPGEARASDDGKWTQLPPGLDPRIPELARRVAATAGPSASAWEQAVAIAAHLQSEYSYSLAPPEPAGGVPPADPLAWFLFESRQGHCEYFATAFTIMLRSIDIPARIVNGFLGGEYNALGDWILVRQNDAHSWVEVNLGPSGWVTMDATPASGSAVTLASTWSQTADWLTRRWHGAILDYELDDQLVGLARIGRVVAPPGDAGVGTALPEVGGMVAVAIFLGLAALLVRGGLSLVARAPRRRHRARGRVERLHARAWRHARKRGHSPPEALPPVEASAWLALRVGDAAAPLQELAWLRYRVRYGGEPDAELAEAARQAWSTLSASPLPRAAGDSPSD